VADTPCKQQEVLFGIVASSPTLTNMTAGPRGVASEPADIPSAVVALQAS